MSDNVLTIHTNVVETPQDMVDEGLKRWQLIILDDDKTTKSVHSFDTAEQIVDAVDKLSKRIVGGKTTISEGRVFMQNHIVAVTDKGRAEIEAAAGISKKENAVHYQMTNEDNRKRRLSSEEFKEKEKQAKIITGETS